MQDLSLALEMINVGRARVAISLAARQETGRGFNVLNGLNS